MVLENTIAKNEFFVLILFDKSKNKGYRGYSTKFTPFHRCSSCMLAVLTMFLKRVRFWEKKTSGNSSFYLPEKYLFFDEDLDRSIFGFRTSCGMLFCKKWWSKITTFFIKVSFKKTKTIENFFSCRKNGIILRVPYLFILGILAHLILSEYNQPVLRKRVIQFLRFFWIIKT